MNSDKLLTPYTSRARSSVRRTTVLAFAAYRNVCERAARAQELPDLETFLRSSNLPYAVQEYIRAQHAKTNDE